MAKVRIITDATAYLEPEFIAKHRITVLPMEIEFGNERFAVTPGESSREILEHMAQGLAKPSQATIPAGALEKALDKLNRESEEILIILSSSKLSKAFARASAVSRAFLGRCRIEIVDSMSISWGLGMVVKIAAQAADAGKSLDEIVRIVRGVLPHIYLVFFVDRLDYLEEGGRLGVAQALLGTMLRIKPLILVEEGEIIPLEKVRTSAMAVEKLASFVAEFANLRRVVILKSPLGGSNSELAGELREQLRQALPKCEFPMVDYDAVLACHLGPEALGVVVYEEW